MALHTGKPRSGIAVLHDVSGTIALDHVFSLHGSSSGGAFGEALTHDGSLLIVAVGNGAAVLDVAKLEQRDPDALVGWFDDGKDAGTVYVAVSLHDRLLFASDEDARRISVFDLAKARLDYFQRKVLIGRIPTGFGPVGLALSPDGRWLYATSEVAPRTLGYATSCRPENASGRWHPQGLLIRIDVDEAMTNPEHSVHGGVQAGCNPVRVAVSPSGSQLWVTARDDGQLLQIPADSLATKSTRLDVTSYKVGTDPVGVAVRQDGKQVWVALSNRFGKTRYSRTGRELVGLTGIGSSDTSVKLFSATASGFPRELSFLPDGRTLVVTCFDAKRVEFVRTPP